MEQFAHDGDDDLFGFLAVFQEPVGEGFEQGVEDPGGHRWHEKSVPEAHGADLGNGGARLARGAAGVVLRGEPGPRSQGPRRSETVS